MEGDWTRFSQKEIDPFTVVIYEEGACMSSNIVLRQHCSTLVNEHELLNEHTVAVVIKVVV